MSLLINRTDFANNHRQVTESNFNTGTLNQHISDAQFIDIQKLLGVDFYNDLIRNSTDAKYQTLLNGGEYTYQSNTYTNVGLKSVIVFYAYSRYILAGSQTDTPFGYVQKTNQNSQEVPQAQKRDISKQNQQTAYNYWENVQAFLNRNESNYSLWENNCIVKKGTFRISKIG